MAPHRGCECRRVFPVLDCSISATNELIDRGHSRGGVVFFVRDRSRDDEGSDEDDEKEEEETPSKERVREKW